MHRPFSAPFTSPGGSRIAARLAAAHFDQGDEIEAAAISVGAGSIISMTNAHANKAQTKARKILGVLGSRLMGRGVGIDLASVVTSQSKMAKRLPAHPPFG